MDDNFSYEVKAEQGRLMVYPKGDLDISTVEQLDRTLDDWMVVTYESITFDCRQVDFVDSTFLRYLVNLKKRCEDIRICNPSRTVLKIFQICGLDKVFLFQNL